MPQLTQRNILIADDHAIVRYGVSSIIKEEFPGATVADADCLNDVLDILSNEAFDLLILDINLPGGNNIQMLDHIRLNHLQMKILMFTAYDDQTLALRYLQAGADGFLVKESTDNEIRIAIRTVINGQQYISESVKKNIFSTLVKREKTANPLTLLSNRENDVMQLFLRGKDIQEIAVILCIHSTTVSTYKKRIFEKLNIKNMVELVEKHRMLSN